MGSFYENSAINLVKSEKLWLNIFMKKKEILYPCSWSYKLIGMSRDDMENAVKPLMKHKEFTLTDSHKKGKYLSLNLSLHVESEEERLSFFSALKDCPGIKMVL